MEYLQHHGIKGQKWGIRRFVDEYGRLTEEGKRRYYNSDNTLTKEGKIAYKNGQISIHDEYERLSALHNSKEKKPNEFTNREYHTYSKEISKGKKYVKELSKQLNEGLVTSFVEDNKGNIARGKTEKGVVVRDKDGNRVTFYDYDAAQKFVAKYGQGRFYTGKWQ